MRIASALRPALAGMLLALLLIGSAGRPVAAQPQPVDLELVLAVDISGSIDEEESRLQRSGYISALTDSRVIDAIQSGPNGRIAVTYMEWASDDYQKVVIGWTVISDAESARAFTGALAAAPRVNGLWTSISAAIDFAVRQFAPDRFTSPRQVIDISGDGTNNNGRAVYTARDEAVVMGITINGLPILSVDDDPFAVRLFKSLDAYYTDHVIGGPGAFMIPARGFDDFASAVLTKLMREIAGAPPDAGARLAMRAD